MASRDSKATWASRVTGERLAHPVPEEKMGPRARRVVVAPTATLVLWGPPGRRESSACQDYQATRAGRGRRAPSDSPASPVPMARRAAGGHLESLDHGDSEARRVHGVREVHGVSLGSPAPRAPLEAMAQPAPQVNGDPMDPKDPQAFPGPRAPRVPQAKTGSQDTQDREARRVSKARLALQVPQAWSAPRVPQERRGPWASVATPGPPGPPGSRASQASRAKRGARETQALPASLGRTAPQDSVASLGTVGFPARWELLD